MKTKRLLSCLLIILLLCTGILSGCSGSDKATMFSDMKKIGEIRSCEYDSTIDFKVKSDDEDIQCSISLNGKTGTKAASADMTVTWGPATYTFKDFFRMTDKTLYFNLSSVFAIFGGTDVLGDDMKDWISLPGTELDEKTYSASLDLYKAIIDSLEKACKDQDISKNKDTWTLNIPSEKMIPFAKAALEEVNSNISSWYDKYVEYIEKSGTEELLKEYSALLGEIEPDKKDDTEDAAEDPVKELKEGKEDALKQWNKMYDEYQKLLDETQKAISDKKMTASGKFDVSLTGKEGSRTASESISFKAEDKDAKNSISFQMSQNMKEIKEVKVDAPSKDDVMTIDEFSNLLGVFMGGLLDDTSMEDDIQYSVNENSLTLDEQKELNDNLKKNQAYLYSSESSKLKPYLLTFDSDVFSPEDGKIGDYFLGMLFNEYKDDSYAGLSYEDISLSEYFSYYIEEEEMEKNYKTTDLSTKAGKVTYVTSKKDEDGYCLTTFGIPLSKNTCLAGSFYLKKENTSKVESYLQALFKDLKPCEKNSL
ncbi:MAG: hypothetical protein Q4F21_03245 [Lachnospiraceae bacterium]|nr:hypothetical protein [Lachnospiraceae bacterium]